MQLMSPDVEANVGAERSAGMVKKARKEVAAHFYKMAADG
jgi:hypothetical protein